MSGFSPSCFSLFCCKRKSGAEFVEKIVRRRLKGFAAGGSRSGTGRYVKGVAQVFTNDQHVAYESSMRRGVAVRSTGNQV